MFKLKFLCGDRLGTEWEWKILGQRFGGAFDYGIRKGVYRLTGLFSWCWFLACSGCEPLLLGRINVKCFE